MVYRPCERPSPPRLYFGPQKLFTLMWIWIQFLKNADPCGSGSVTLFFGYKLAMSDQQGHNAFYQYASFWSQLFKVQQLVIGCLERRIPHVSNSSFVKNSSKRHSPRLLRFLAKITIECSVPDPDPPDPHVFGPPGSGSTSQRYGSGSFYHHAKIVRKTLIPSILWLFLTFYLRKMM